MSTFYDEAITLLELWGAKYDSLHSSLNCAVYDLDRWRWVAAKPEQVDYYNTSARLHTIRTIPELQQLLAELHDENHPHPEDHLPP